MLHRNLQSLSDNSCEHVNRNCKNILFKINCQNKPGIILNKDDLTILDIKRFCYKTILRYKLFLDIKLSCYY